MMKLRLLVPQAGDEKIVMDYRREFWQNNDSMDGTAGLQGTDEYAQWYAAVCDNQSQLTVRDGLVPSSTFLAVDEDNALVGMIDIRHRLNDYLLNFGGHIGYSVRKSRRRKGYATQMLKLSLGECAKLGIDRCLITCNKENIGSAKTIIKNGGVLENEVQQGDIITQRYWIDTQPHK